MSEKSPKPRKLRSFPLVVCITRIEKKKKKFETKVEILFGLPFVLDTTQEKKNEIIHENISRLSCVDIIF